MNGNTTKTGPAQTTNPTENKPVRGAIFIATLGIGVVVAWFAFIQPSIDEHRALSMAGLNQRAPAPQSNEDPRIAKLEKQIADYQSRLDAVKDCRFIKCLIGQRFDDENGKRFYYNAADAKTYEKCVVIGAGGLSKAEVQQLLVRDLGERTYTLQNGFGATSKTYLKSYEVVSDPNILSDFTTGGYSPDGPFRDAVGLKQSLQDLQGQLSRIRHQ